MHDTIDQKISVIILTLNAEENIEKLLADLNRQTVQPCEVIIVDSESKDKTVQICMAHGASVLPIKRSDFNHGGTRNYALRQSKGDYVLFLTHDAIPSDKQLLEKLSLTLSRSDKMAAVYARQLPREDATYMERLVRDYNYPVESHIYSSSDIVAHGIKTFFMSDVCAMYKRSVYLELGGFETDIKTNEDMLYAAKAINNGYSIGYEASAYVVHSHNFSLAEQYKRNYIQGYEIERHKELLTAGSQNAQGMKLVKVVSKEMLSHGRVFSWIRFGFDCCARYAGSYLGKRKARSELVSSLDD